MPQDQGTRSKTAGGDAVDIERGLVVEVNHVRSQSPQHEGFAADQREETRQDAELAEEADEGAVREQNGRTFVRLVEGRA